MAKIQLTPEELIRQSTEMFALRDEYEALLKRTESTLTSVNANWSAVLSRNFLGKLNSTKNSCDKIVTVLGTGAELAKLSAETFQSLDGQLAKYMAGGEANFSVDSYLNAMDSAIANGKKEEKKEESSKKKETKKSKKEEKKSWWDKLCDGAENMVDDVKTGVAKVVDVVEDGVESVIDFGKEAVDTVVDASMAVGGFVVDAFEEGVEMVGDAVDAVIDSYQEKGLAYKIVKTGTAVATTIGSCAAIVAAWGAAAGTGGLGTGLAVTSTVYGVNSIANSFADIYNCWAGDVEDVGKVDLLKTGLTEAGEAVGGLFGAEEFGGNVGEAIYNGGKLVAIVNNINNLMGEVTQLDDVGLTIKEGMSELKQGVSGVVDIALHSDLGSIGLDMAMLAHTVPKLGEAINAVSTVGELVKESWELGTGAGDVINALIGQESGGSLMSALGWDNVETVMNIITGGQKTGEGVVEKLPDLIEDIGDFFDAQEIISGNA